MNTAHTELLTRLNLESGKLDWGETERHFARGVVVKVAAELDLVEVAAAMAEDDKAVVARWLEHGQIARASSEDAIRWNAAQSEFWAVVVAPWVLVQEIGPKQ
ncbi:MAG: DUF2288 domain-containing protein [Methylococcaceae bacterium]|nr:DUF2288 domain-containing protein [Methylococcaceae bacterium]